MVYSMTGFATKTGLLVSAAKTQSAVSVSIKSLNSRFFEVNCKLPPFLSFLETIIIKSLKKNLIRGHMYVTVYMPDSSFLGGAVSVSLPTARSYYDALSLVHKEFNFQEAVSLDCLLKFPGIILVQDTNIDASLEHDIMAIFNELIGLVVKERALEGESLYEDLMQRAHGIEKEAAIIAEKSIILLEEQKKKVASAVQEQQLQEANGTTVHDNKLSLLYSSLDKMDIHEEIVRMQSHIGNFKHVLDDKKIVEKGKRIDFILQELAREINTITAKCSDGAITGHAINIKVDVEKAREQTQNIL